MERLERYIALVKLHEEHVAKAHTRRILVRHDTDLGMTYIRCSECGWSVEVDAEGKQLTGERSNNE